MIAVRRTRNRVSVAPAPATPAPSAVVSRLRAAGCVFAEDEAALLIAAAPTPDALTALVDRRVAGLPLEHILGWAEFCGMRIAVDPGVFVPRRRTELVVIQALAAAPDREPTIVVDLCCGCGAVGVAIASALHDVQVHAVDIDPAAVRCASSNLAAAGDACLGDLYGPLPAELRGQVDILIANAPYVPTDELRFMPPEARVHEPPVALDGGSDGLDILRRVISEAPGWLAPDGHLHMESSRRQAPALVGESGRAGMLATVRTCDELGATVGSARRP